MGAGDDPRSCRFSQMMEQRLEKVFSEAQAKVLNTNSRLSVQVLWLNKLQHRAGPPASGRYSVVLVIWQLQTHGSCVNLCKIVPSGFSFQTRAASEMQINYV